MINLTDFKNLNKSKMVITIIEIMVKQGWEIGNFVYSFKSYTKNELIENYKRLLNYNDKIDKIKTEE